METSVLGVFGEVFTEMLTHFTTMMGTLFEEPLFLVVFVLSVLFTIIALVKSVL